jgi:hypothetical protein|tara:strand:+ start:121 stop:1266 length:1146 start_codon:yes stop_codon:yes gene_type:complete
MADVKISQLTALASASSDVAADVLAIVDTSVPQTKKITIENLVAPITLDKSNSRVGIGASSPSASLHVSGSAILQNDSSTLNFYNTAGAQRAFLQLSGTGLIIDTDSFLEFKPNNSTAMYIDSSGKVGIGTTSPTHKLSVEGDATDGGTGNDGQLVLRGATNTDLRLMMGMDTSSEYGFISPMKLGTSWNNLSLCYNGGNVGIGDNSPSAKLDVNGDIQIQGANALLLNHTTGAASDTYINSPSDNVMAFRTGGTERFSVDYNGTFVIKESTGDPDSTKLYLQSTKTYTDDEYENFDIAGRGAIVTVAVTTSGNQRSGLFFIDTASITVIKVADPSSDFAASDTDDKICVFKSSGNSNTFSVKNRKGGDRAISVSIIATGA